MGVGYRAITEVSVSDGNVGHCYGTENNTTINEEPFFRYGKEERCKRYGRDQGHGRAHVCLGENDSVFCAGGAGAVVLRQ